MPQDDDTASELPMYYPGSASGRSSFSRSRTPVEHSCSLTTRNDVPWATLKVNSNASSPKYLPSYFGGQDIVGSVSLDLSKVDTIQSIIVTLSGQIVATGAAPFVFWEIPTVLWSTELGDPRSPTPRGQIKHSGKLQGKYRWDFSFTMPSTCTVRLKPKDPPTSMPLPPSFSEKGATQYINYELNVWFRRGSLRIDSKLGTSFGFSPRIRPGPPSLLRQIAYQEHSPLIGPDGDPDGWKVLPPIAVKGKLFGQRAIEATCTFAIATPLCYTRGTTIPCSLTVTSRDRHAADLLTSPASPTVHLLRMINYGAEQAQTKTTPKQAMKHATTEVASAIWWPTKSGASTDVLTRRLDGEIHLPRDVQPSFVFGRFSLTYAVVMLPFRATAFEPAGEGPLFSEPVDIATIHAHGPLPRASAPPGYDQMKRKPTTYGVYQAQDPSITP